MQQSILNETVDYFQKTRTRMTQIERIIMEINRENPSYPCHPCSTITFAFKAKCIKWRTSQLMIRITESRTERRKQSSNREPDAGDINNCHLYSF
jgi:hypothetical protein